MICAVLAACGGEYYDDTLIDEAGAVSCGDGVCDEGEQNACIADCSRGDSANCGVGAILPSASGTTEGVDVTRRWDTYADDYSGFREPIVVSVPSDAQAITVTLWQDDQVLGFDRVLFNGSTVTSAYDEPSITTFDGDGPAVSFLMPNNERTRLAEGCLAIYPYAEGDIQGSEVTVVVVTRRENPGSLLDMNVVRVGNTDISDDEVGAALQVVDTLYGNAGAPRIGEVEFWNLEGDAVVDAEGREIEDLRRYEFQTPRRLNVFLVSSFDEEGTLGIAAGIPAPPFETSPASGLVVAVDEHLSADGTSLDTQLLGETLAHEVGHMFGLYHTTEAEGGEYDVIADTPRCPDSADDGDGEFTAEECESFDGRNLMFWTAGDFSQNQLTPMQSEVLSAYPVAR
jgi:hypothetical protein